MSTNNGFNTKISWYLLVGSILLMIFAFIIYTFIFPCFEISSGFIILNALLIVLVLALLYDNSAIQRVNHLNQILNEKKEIIEKKDLEINKLSKRIEVMVDAILEMQSKNKTETKNS